MSNSEASVDGEVDRLYDLVVARANACRGRPIILEALWDGDTQGWMLCLFVTLRRRFGRRTREAIEYLRYGGDIRLFSDHRLEPEAVARFARLAVGEVERLLETHDPKRTFDEIPPIQVPWRGRELELEPRMTCRAG